MFVVLRKTESLTRFALLVFEAPQASQNSPEKKKTQLPT